MNNRSVKTSYEKFALLLIWSGVPFIILGIIFLFIKEIAPLARIVDLESFGAFGEFIGGLVGSVWALAGVMLFYEALKQQGRGFEIQRSQLELQREEILHQRKELELQRKEIKRQTEQLEDQNKTLATQKFENTFFQLLKIHNKIVLSNEHKDLGIKWSKSLYLRFIGKYQRLSQDNGLSELELIDKSYRTFIKRPEYLDRYFSHLYYLFRFLSQSELENKKFYADIVKAQLTVHELMLIFYYGITKLSKPDFKTLMEEFSFFEDMPKNELISSSHSEFYDKDALSK